jgi:signal transduction histidine kinase
MRQRLAAAERQGALEGERARIARDMHDEIGARLTQITILSAMANDSAADASEVRTQTEKLSHVSKSLTRSLDEIVWAVRPQNDNLESLVDYLDEALRDLCEDSTVRFWFSGPVNVPKLEVPATLRHNVLLACFEAVNNTLKYSQATELRVSAKLDGQSFNVEITDDGCGFDVARGEAKRSGLLHMRQRLEEVGGSVELSSAPGRGTSLKFSVPLADGLVTCGVEARNGVPAAEHGHA